ncbi:hypothetical protein F6455_03670 [Proteobacteria bacterium 005FR1]|nr:hypothetical protein [Proteobacteria bacterium 005FR1]
MKLLISSLTAALLALGSQALFAQGQSPAFVGELEEDQIRGVVVEVSPGKDSLTVETTEVGEKLDVPTNEMVTFEISEDTYVQDSLRSTILDLLRNVQVGDVVRLEFDPENQEMIRDVQEEEKQ